MESPTTTRGSFAKGTQKGKKHIGYNQSQRRAYLDDFITNYHSLNASKFCREKGLSRQTFRGWWANKEQILDEKNTFSPKRKRQRESIHPELDRLLFDWFIDFRKRYGTIPISRQILLQKALHFQSLLQMPISEFRTATVPADGETAQALDDTAREEDFVWSADMFVDDSYRSPNSNSTPPEKQSPAVTYIRGLCNPGVHCYMNSILQQLFYLPNFRETIANEWRFIPHRL